MDRLRVCFDMISTPLVGNLPFVLDASSKLIHNGMSMEPFTDLGHFDQCLANAFQTNKEETHLDGKYCLFKMRPPLPQRRPRLKYTDRVLDFRNTSLENKALDRVLSHAVSLYSNPFRFGICIPSDCEGEDIRKLFNNSGSKYRFIFEVENDCYTGDSPSLLDIFAMFKRLDTYSWISIVIIDMMCGAVGLATISEFIYDLLYDSTPDSQKPWILCFSLISNVKNLYSLKTINDSNKDMQSINGFRLMAILWTVVSNVYLLGYQPQIRAFINNVGQEMGRRGGCPFFQLILNSWSASEVFFFVGALLMAYTVTKELEISCGRLSVIKYLAKRVIRLVPPIVFPITLLFLMPVLPNGGPIYNSSTERLRDVCAQNWWKSLFLITNWMDPTNTCLPHLWFVSALFQLNLIGIIVLVVTHQRPRLFKLLSLTAVLIGIVFPMYTTYHFNLSAKSPIMDRPLLDEIPDDLRLNHFQTLNHLSVFFIGLSIGRKFNSRQTKYSMTIFVRLFLWSVLPMLSLISVLITFLWNDIQSDPSLGLSIVFNGLNRLTFISGIAWIINECLYGKASLIGRVLSHKLLLPLSRLTYQIYLLNMIVVWMYFFTKREMIAYRDIEMLFISGGVFVFTVMLSIFGYLVFEVPFIRLSKRVFRSETKAKPSLETKVKTADNFEMNGVKVDNFEINGNAINGKNVGNNDQNIDIRL